MTKITTENDAMVPNTDFILSEDIAAQKLLKEIYSHLKLKDPSDLSISEHCWVRSIEDLYNDKKLSISNKVDWYVKIGRDLIEEEKTLNSDEKMLLDSFRRVLDVSAKNNSLTTFFTELENSVESLFRLDFSRKIEIPSALASDENDLLSYIVMTIEMIRERLSQSVVSGKVMREVVGKISDIGVLVTDELGKIRFSNERIEEMLNAESDGLIGTSIWTILDKDNQLIGFSEVEGIEFVDVQRMKVPSIDGQIDEWAYLFTNKKEAGMRLERFDELRAVMHELYSCDRNDTVQMNVLLEILRSKFERVDLEVITEVGLGQSGTNLRMLIEECLMDLRQNGSVDIVVDSNDSVKFFGESEGLKTIIRHMLTCAEENLSKSPQLSKLEIVVSSFQHYLLIAVMDNGAIASNFTLIQEMRDQVTKLEGTLELNSGRMGNNLTIILPV